MKKKLPVLILSVIAVCIAAAAVVLMPFNTEDEGSEYSALIKKYAHENGIETEFVYAVIKTESGFNPNAISDADAIGLMQMTEETFDWVKWKTDGDEEFDDLFDPKTSIKYGTWFLGYLYEEFGSYATVAAAYHAGVNQVRTWLADSAYSADGVNLDTIPVPKTSHYVKKVMSNYEEYCGN